MAKNLVIVESPAKAKTIAKFLGKDYEVKSSFGHIRDLPKKGISIDIENNFEPNYEITSDKTKVVKELKAAAKSSTVWLASDEDREGEAIAWHLTKALNLDSSTTKRIVFHEITKPAIENAIKNPRTIDQNLVNAQQARRVLDRLVGYELSPVLWKKIRSGLSAGRVQSVAVRIIVDREREINDFIPDSNYKITGLFERDGQEFKAELDDRIKTIEDSKKWLESLTDAEYKISNINLKPATRSAGGPFTTSTLQQEASRRLGLSVRQTMSLAQRLYENGDITYMRTDSTTLSDLAVNAAKEYIIKNFGEKYSDSKQYKNKNSNAQEAHEAIRPTDFNRTTASSGDELQSKLYKLIWQRTLASQMSKALFEKTEVTINISGHEEQFVAKGEILKFEGYTAVIGNQIEDSLLPELELGQILNNNLITATETFSRTPARYSEATLVRKLEELGIGRPSTYAPTISVIQTRGYIEKVDMEGVAKDIRVLELTNGQVQEKIDTLNQGADKGKLIPTPIADITTDFLVKYFPAIVDFDFTAKVEGSFDGVADGKQDWHVMIKEFYKDFHKSVEDSSEISRQEVSKMRLLGNDPKNNEPVFARFGRFGPMIQRGETSEDKSIKPTFAPMPDNTTVDNVTLEQALTMLELPRTVGKTEDGKEIKANIGRFGPYIQVDKLFISIKPLDPHSITEEEAREKYLDKLQKNSEKNIKEFKNGIKVLNGPYGPYVTDGKKNARLAKTVVPADLTEEEATEILKSAPTKRRKITRKKK